MDKLAGILVEGIPPNLLLCNLCSYGLDLARSDGLDMARACGHDGLDLTRACSLDLARAGGLDLARAGGLDRAWLMAWIWTELMA